MVKFHFSTYLLTKKLFYFYLLFYFILSNDCIITNKTKISSQWLNNIICLGDKSLTYVNFATFPNGDMVVESTAIPDNLEQRVFYGIKRNGEPLFSNGEYHSIIKISGETKSNNARYEAEIFNITIDNKDYLFSIGLGSNEYAELYDLNKSETISKVLSTTFVDNSDISNVRGSSTSFISSGQNYIIFPFLGDDTKLVIKRLYFSSTSLSNNPIDKSYSVTSKGNSVSCFITINKFVLCLFLQKSSLWQYYYIGIYNENLVKIKEIKTDYYTTDLTLKYYIYSKCIHLENEAGAFIFYKAYQITTVLLAMETYPTIIFKSTDGTSITNYFSYDEYEINKKSFDSSSLLNDFIKISNKKLIFTSTSTSKEELYIVLINIFSTNKIVIRYYTLEIFTLYTFKIFNDMRVHPYNNYAAFAFSFCRKSPCESETDSHYAGFMIFSYSNGTDYSFNLTNYIFNNNNMNNLEINLQENVKIDNNIFGLIYSSIQIKEINNCDNLNLTSSISHDEINQNSSIQINEKIDVSLKALNLIDCNIKYIYIITEPDFETYNNYGERIISYGVDTKTIFNNEEKNFYESRVLNFEIILDENLVNQCTNENCELCRESMKDICLICISNYDFTNDKKNKICETNTEEIEKDSTYSLETSKNEIDSTNNIETSNNEVDSTSNLETSIFEKVSTSNTEYTMENEVKISDITKQTNKEDKKEEDSTNSKTCSNSEILNNNCHNGKMNNTQTGEVYNSLKETLLSEEYNGTETIIETENVIFQISTLEDQKYSNNPNISSIDLGTCEDILKDHYNISKELSLIVLKVDIKSEDLSSTYVQYEIYHPISKTPLELSYCNEVTIVVNVPVNLNDNEESLYDSLSGSGYNLFDSEDDFYNDICSTYTSENGTDMTLSDRKSEIYSVVENISLCQIGCEFESYNKTTKKAKCNCEAQIDSTETDFSKIDFSTSKMASSFLTTLTNSNFLVLKCYKLILELKDIMANKGRFILTIIYALFLLFLIIYISIDRKKIRKYINDILKMKANNPKIPIKKINPKEVEVNKKTQAKENRNKKTNNKINKNKTKKNKTKPKNKEAIRDKIKSKHKDKKIENIYNNKNKRKNEKKTINKIKNKKINKIKEPPKKKRKSNSISNNEMINTTNKNIYINSEKNQKKKQKNININIIPIQNITYGKFKLKNKNKNKLAKTMNIYPHQIKAEKGKLSNNKSKNITNDKEIGNLNDHELNNLDYHHAILIDKRTYFQYYWSLVKKKQLLLFTFLASNDYNLFSLKFSLLLLSFSLFFTINGFFFSDDTMHKIHEDNGAFNIIYQLPQIIYSSVISAIINVLLKNLSLSEKNILFLKQIKDLKVALLKSKNIEKCITIKFIIFFILSNILLLFFWYFISCFCGVYKNTQSILIEDTLFSFGLSMIYPFGLNILPGMLRIPALREKNKNRITLYKISLIIALYI